MTERQFTRRGPLLQWRPVTVHVRPPLLRWMLSSWSQAVRLHEFTRGKQTMFRKADPQTIQSLHMLMSFLFLCKCMCVYVCHEVRLYLDVDFGTSFKPCHQFELVTPAVSWFIILLVAVALLHSLGILGVLK